MKTLDFLSYLASKNIKLWVDGEKLRYSAPPETLTEDLRQELINRKSEIRAFLLSSSHVPAIQPAPRDKALPLSFAQQRLWFLDQLHPGNAAYNIFAAVRLTGALHVTALEQSISEIIRRHEALRTTFVVEKGEPVQRISPPAPFKLSRMDLRDISDAEQEAQARQLLSEEALRPFDLAEGPLFRCALLQLGEEEYVLQLSMHHIVSDGWSMGVLIRELQTLYGAFSRQLPSPLPELTIQYADFAHWQRQWLQGEVLENQLLYWKQQLKGELPVLELPLDHPRPAIQTYKGAGQSFIVPPATLSKLKTLSQQEGSTLFMTLLAVFKILLYRYTSQTDIIVGSPIANRNQAEIAELIGCFVNTLIFRTDLSNDPSFRELLGRVREAALGAYAHQDAPFEALVKALQPKRDASRPPLFQVMFAIQNDPPLSTMELPGLILSPVESEGGTAQFDLSVYAWETPKGLELIFVYNTDLFETATMTRMMEHFRTLLENSVANPEQRISEIPMLTAAERHHLLVEWNDTAVDYPQNVTLHQLFEEQVERTPDNVALVFENEKLTYRELNQRANQLAHHLQALGVGPEAFVGVFMERSLEMVISLYGILKAGGAYVPLDPEYPADRIAFMIEDTRVPVVLTQKHLAHKLPAHSARVICLDSGWSTIAKESVENPLSGATPNNPAYVIYTSGSTGKPKGVINEHRGICNQLLWMQEAYQLTGADRVLQKTPFSFDVSVWEFFCPLQVGARLVVAQPGGHKDGAYLIKVIVEQEITMIHFVPSMLPAFLQNKSVEECHSLKRVICSGEALPVDLQQRFFDRLDAELHNLYGPTETAVHVTYWACQKESDLNVVPIGRPVANTQMYILDSRLQPVPIGVPGVLYIGGVQVARGYLNRPDLTEEKFIHDPFRQEPGARIYNTGDLTRFLPDGNIEYLGRIDHQVKLRGFRIELGEIEATLDRHDAIRASVVIAREDKPGDKRLAAYFLADSAEVPTSSELRKYMQERLPEYMVPSFFIKLDEFPLTASGKIDRKRLPEPDGLRTLSEDFVAPATPMERMVATIWQQVLGVDHISAFDNFFDLGGHSLLSMRVINEIENRTGKRLSPREMVFQTLTEIAASCEAGIDIKDKAQSRGFTKKLFSAIKEAVS
jgi:amino acid adenylation domain-containing protein